MTLTSSVEFAHPLQAENGFAEAYFLSIVNVVICRDEISPLYPFAKGFIEEYTKEKRFAQLKIMACRSSDLLIIVYNLYRVELALYMNGFKLRKHKKKPLSQIENKIDKLNSRNEIGVKCFIHSKPLSGEGGQRKSILVVVTLSRRSNFFFFPFNKYKVTEVRVFL